MRPIFCVLLLAALAFGAAPATNVTGRWSGTFKMVGQETQPGDATAFLVLQQQGSEITGTVGSSPEQQHAIAKGKIEGDKITLQFEAGGGAVQCDLVAAADRITGDVKISQDGQTLTGKLDVTRAK